MRLVERRSRRDEEGGSRSISSWDRKFPPTLRTLSNGRQGGGLTGFRECFRRSWMNYEDDGSSFPLEVQVVCWEALGNG